MSILNEALKSHCLLVAHGSRLETSNNEIRMLAALLRGTPNEFDHIECAFLEMAEPSIEAGLQLCIAQGANEIVVIPYFLAAGRHVRSDIPEQVERVKKQFPGIDIRMTEHIGANNGMAQFLLAHVSATQVALYKADKHSERF